MRRLWLFILVLSVAWITLCGCTNGKYDPAKGNALVAATTNPVITQGVPVVVTAAAGPVAGAETAAGIAAIGAVIAAVVGYLNHKNGSDTLQTVAGIAGAVSTVANAADKAVSPTATSRVATPVVVGEVAPKT